LVSQRLHIVAAEGVPISGDIIHSFCRLLRATWPENAVRIALAERQKWGFVLFHFVRPGDFNAEVAEIAEGRQ
jgi:hypothetical protein